MSLEAYSEQASKAAALSRSLDRSSDGSIEHSRRALSNVSNSYEVQAAMQSTRLLVAAHIRQSLDLSFLRTGR